MLNLFIKFWAFFFDLPKYFFNYLLFFATLSSFTLFLIWSSFLAYFYELITLMTNLCVYDFNFLTLFSIFYFSLNREHLFFFALYSFEPNSSIRRLVFLVKISLWDIISEVSRSLVGTSVGTLSLSSFLRHTKLFSFLKVFYSNDLS